MVYNFYLINGSNQLEVPEPIGWSGLSLKMERSDRYHGISISYSDDAITFYGQAADFIREIYERDGVDAAIKFEAVHLCEGMPDDIDSFMLDFGRYVYDCDNCNVSIGIEQESCYPDFSNGFDKSIDILSDKAIDGVTVLPDASTMKVKVVAPAVGILLQDRAEVGDAAITGDLNDAFSWDLGADGYALIPLPNVKFSSLGSFYFPSFWDYSDAGTNGIPPYQDYTTINSSEIIGNAKCNFNFIEISFRLKGSATYIMAGGGNLLMRLKLWRLPAGQDETVPSNWVQLDSNQLFHETVGSGTRSFDYSNTLAVPFTQGDKITYAIYVQKSIDVPSITMTLDATDSFFNAQGVALCEESDAEVFLPFETINRAAQSVTNGCLTLQSSILGRVDSYPHHYPADGCASMTAITTGLFLRKAEKPTFFATMKELIEGYLTIYNLGFAIIDDKLVIEPARWFYQNIPLLDCSDAVDVKMKVDPSRIAGTINAGYSKWEITNTNGLNEINSTREYSLSIKNAKTAFDYLCKFVAGRYPYELTRQQSFAITGSADTSYDDSKFVLCLERDTSYGYGYGGTYTPAFMVEQFSVGTPQNIIDPDTVINYRITPVRNMMRLAPLFTGAFREYLTGKVSFRSGTGNIEASGEYLGDCLVESKPMSEREDIEPADYDNVGDAIPFLRPEIVTFDYPLSADEYARIVQNPYGYILHSCGGRTQKAYILSLSYSKAAGKASFELINAYQ